jgi:hypothetical protein
MSDWPHSPVHPLAEAGAYMVSLRGDQCGVPKRPSHIQAEGFPYRRAIVRRSDQSSRRAAQLPSGGVQGGIKPPHSKAVCARKCPNLRAPCGGARNGPTSSSRTRRTGEHQGRRYFVAAIALSISAAAESINTASSFNTFATTTICSSASFHFLSSIASRTAGMVLTP